MKLPARTTFFALNTAFCVAGHAQTAKMPPIDRHALVTRHNPHVTNFDPYSALSVGNGEFAFTADTTGLQRVKCANIKGERGFDNGKKIKGRKRHLQPVLRSDEQKGFVLLPKH